MTSPFKYLTFKMASVRVGVGVGACVHACAVDTCIKREVLRASLMYAFGHAYGLPYNYKMVTLIATKGLFNTVFSVHFAALYVA